MIIRLPVFAVFSMSASSSATTTAMVRFLGTADARMVDTAGCNTSAARVQQTAAGPKKTAPSTGIRNAGGWRSSRNPNTATVDHLPMLDPLSRRSAAGKSPPWSPLQRCPPMYRNAPAGVPSGRSVRQRSRSRALLVACFRLCRIQVGKDLTCTLIAVILWFKIEDGGTRCPTTRNWTRS